MGKAARERNRAARAAGGTDEGAPAARSTGGAPAAQDPRVAALAAAVERRQAGQDRREGERRQGERRVPVAVGYPEDWRAELARIRRQIRTLRQREDAVVAQAVAAGATWSGIANALGAHRQNVHRRYRHLRPVPGEGAGS